MGSLYRPKTTHRISDRSMYGASEASSDTSEYSLVGKQYGDKEDVSMHDEHSMCRYDYDYSQPK